MKLLLDFPTIGEPHYAQALPASMIRDKQVKFYTLAENANPYVDASRERTAASRATGKRVDVKMIAIRSHFAPDNIEGVQVGDTVYFHVTNIEQDWDILHGFAVLGANNVRADPAAGRDAHAEVDAEERRASTRSTAPTSARRCTRRCRATSACRRRARRWRSSANTEPEGAGAAGAARCSRQDHDAATRT